MSITLEFLPLDADELPVSKLFNVSNSYTFLFRENVRHSKIYLEIRDSNDEILYTTRLVYGGILYHAVVDGLTFDDPVIPLNMDDLLVNSVVDTVVTPDNLDRVKLYVIAE